MSRPNSTTSKPSPPDLLPFNDLIGLHADDRSSGRDPPVVKKEKRDMFPDHDGSKFHTDKREFVTCVPGSSNPYTSAVGITVYGPTQRASFYQNDPANGGFSVKLLCKSDGGNKSGHLPTFEKNLATSNLYDFDVYKNDMHLPPEMVHGKYCPTDALLPPSSVELANMETTIYDLSIYSGDIQLPCSTAIGHTRRRVTTEPSVYSAQIDRNCSFKSNQKPIDGPDTSLPLLISKTSVFAVQPINRSGKVKDHKEALICFPPATQFSSSEEKRPSAASQISHVRNPSRGRRSQGLDEIIALLDACVSQSSQGVVPARRSIALSDDLWDEGSLFELYAI
ncbi:hypothetical protein BDZ94DRAFT_1272114 [Collybia nuda]|uniref:Uncharacterized protein n=1 Tax=Collybia nuda TaxID=64659 RepID=A0A9P5XWH7_9AGAR|nr:hypothetical protein BDZ94DRAFT_1272114 [Collybia nuda]